MAESELEDIEIHIHALLDEDVDEVERAESYLLENAERAHPLLLKHVCQREYGWTSMAVVLGRIGYEDSVPVLRDALLDTGNDAVAYALALHQSPQARTTLIEALDSGEPRVVESAAYGLANRQDHTVCPFLRSRVGAPDSRVGAPDPHLRFQLMLACITLQCFTRRELESHRSDPDQHIRDLVNKALGERP